MPRPYKFHLGKYIQREINVETLRAQTARRGSGHSSARFDLGLKRTSSENLARFSKKLAQDVVHGLRVGPSARGLHDLADEKLEDSFVASFELGDVRRILGDDFSRGLFDGGIAHLRAEPLGGDNLRGATAGLEHSGEHFFADGDGDFAGFDELHQFGEGCGRDWAPVNFLAGIFQATEKFGLHPAGGGFAWSSGLYGGFEIASQSLCVGEDFGVVTGNAE